MSAQTQPSLNLALPQSQYWSQLTTSALSNLKSSTQTSSSLGHLVPVWHSQWCQLYPSLAHKPLPALSHSTHFTRTRKPVESDQTLPSSMVQQQHIEGRGWLARLAWTPNKGHAIYVHTQPYSLHQLILRWPRLNPPPWSWSVCSPSRSHHAADLATCTLPFVTLPYMWIATK